MRAMLEEDAHWKLSSGSGFASFNYPSTVGFFLFGRGEGLHRVNRVVCEMSQWTSIRDGEALLLNTVTFHENDDGPNECFRFPVDCVWVAGEVEL